tara:strand:+ start:486 stop:791 length:306 start_codon:yes stop_codon:yes gene_type:complete
MKLLNSIFSSFMSVFFGFFSLMGGIIFAGATANSIEGTLNEYADIAMYMGFLICLLVFALAIYFQIQYWNQEKGEKTLYAQMVHLPPLLGAAYLGTALFVL